MNPATTRIAILISELMLFLVTSAFTAYFISHASALQLATGDATPAHFPVLVYDGDRAKPAAGNYRVMPWGEWERFAAGNTSASLLPPERAAAGIKIGDTGEASFTASDAADSRQEMELKWTSGGGEQHARYIASTRAIEARYLRTLGSQTLLTSVLVGFVVGLLGGRVLRRRWLAVPGYVVPPSPK